MPSKTKPNKTMFPSPLVVKFYTNMFNKLFKEIYLHEVLYVLLQYFSIY